MALFSDEQAVYAALGRVFQDLVTDPELTEQLATVDACVQYQFRKPESTITVVLREGPAVEFGPTHFDPDVIWAMDADTAHQLFLGELNVTTALAGGQVKARGPASKVLRLVAPLALVAPRYQARVAELEAIAASGGSAEDVAETPGEEPATEAEAVEPGEAAEPEAPRAAEAEAPVAEPEGADPEPPAAEPEASAPEPEAEPPAAEPQPPAAEPEPDPSSS